MKKHIATVNFKDPDFTGCLGLSQKACNKILDKAEYAEYFAFEIEFDHDGNPVGVRQLDISGKG